MLLWVGLGNPGTEYAQHRHNVGFMAVDRIADRHRFGPWRRKFRGELAEGTIAEAKVLLLKPLTFMNDSGESVLAAAGFHKLTPGDVTVFHDELDLAPGKVRVKRGGGAAGHNGLRSTDRHLGNDFWRVRLGIGHPGHKDLVNRHVLGNFAKADQDWREAMLDAVADAAALLAQARPEEFMTRVALLMQSKEPR